MTTSDLRLGPLTSLVGTWAGTGRGIYPTIPTFDYREEISFVDGGVKPFLAYVQRTSAVDDGRPLHAESGYVRWTGGTAEWIIASPTGVTEAHTAQIEHIDGGVEFVFRTASMAASPTAKRVDSVERRLIVRDGELRYELHMAAVGEQHQLHLTALLRRA